MATNGMDEEFQDLEGDLEDDLYTVLDDDTREELNSLMGHPVVGLELWDESLGDEEGAEPVKPEERAFFDCDLLFEDGVALELYVTAAYPDPDKDSLKGMEQIFEVVGKLSDDNLELLDYDQADEEGGLALAFGKEDKVQLILVASAWMISEWEETEETEDEEEDVEEDDGADG